MYETRMAESGTGSEQRKELICTKEKAKFSPGWWDRYILSRIKDNGDATNDILVARKIVFKII